MRKRILSICLSLMVAATGLSGAGLVSRAAEIQVEAAEMPVEQEVQEEAAVIVTDDVAEAEVEVEEAPVAEDELQSDMFQVPLIQDGYFNTAHISGVDEVEVLSGEQVWETAFKQRIAEAMRTFQTEVYVYDLGIYKCEANNQRMKELYQEVIDSNPSFFYAYGGFVDRYVTNGNEYDLILFYDEAYLDANGNIDMTKIAAYQTALAEAMTVVKSGMSDVEKVLALHDYLVLNCTYDYENYLRDTLPNTVYSSYGALVNKTAVCSGYSMAMAEMLRQLGFTCYVVGSDDMNHAWNLVYLNGAWYHIDATWDDPVDYEGADYNDEGLVMHDNFLKSDAEIAKTGHYNWFQEYTENKLPTADKEAAFAGNIFWMDEYASFDAGTVVMDSSFTYYDGYWYYLTYTGERYGDGVAYITRSKIDGSDKTIFTNLGAMNFVQMIDGRLYFSDLMGAYTAPLADLTQCERILTTLGSKSFVDYVISEFAVYGNGVIGIEFCGIYSDTFVRTTFDVTTRETIPMPTLVITKSPTVNYSSNPGRVAMDGEYCLGYADGFYLPVRVNEIMAWHDYLGEEGVYDVELVWRDLSTTYQVSRQNDFLVSDVLASSSNWQYAGIRYVYDNGYMVPSGTLFSPNVTLSRSMLVQILYAMEEKPEVEYKQTFSDVREGEWYADAVTWAYENGITSGYSDGRFGVDDPIQREQAALMLKKYAVLKQIDTSEGADLSRYTDYTNVSEWAAGAMSWANHNGIISGKGEILDPTGNASRAEMAAMITKFRTNVIDGEE